jgi:hypothetical protein
MAGRFSRSMTLVHAAWAVVRADKELLWLPVCSAAALLLLVASFVVPAASVGAFDNFTPGEPTPAFLLGVFLFYVLAWFVGLFFTAALVGAATVRLDGGDPTLRMALGIAWSRAGRIFGYALVAASVGALLRLIEERVGWIGRIVARLIGVGWALATFLVVPILVTRDLGPLESVRESASLLRRTWGENLIGQVGLGFAFGLAYLLLFAVAGVAALVAVEAGLGWLAGAVGLLALAAGAVLAAVQSTMQAIYATALYRYATQPDRPVDGFDAGQLQLAFQPKS